MARTAIVSVRITGDASDAERALLKAARAAEKFNRQMSSLGRAVALNTIKQSAKAMSNFSFAIAAVGFAAPIAASALVALGSAAVGMAAIGGAAFAAVKLGMDGIKKAAETAAPAFNALKAATSAAFEQSMIPGFQKLSTLMGTITPQMTALSSTIGQSFTDMATAITDQGGGAIQGIIANAQTFIAGITPGLQSLLLGILSLANQASQVIAGAAPQISTLLGSIGEKLSGITAADIVQAFTDLRDRANEVWQAIEPIANALRTMSEHATLMFQLAVALKAVQIAVALVSVATSAWAAVQWVLNAALLANPITWIVIAVIALIAVIVLIATKTTWFQTIWQTMVSVAVEAWQRIVSAVQLFLGVASAIWSAVVAGFTAAWNAISTAASAVWNAISSACSTMANVIQTVISTAINVAIGVFNRLKSIGSSVMGAIQGAVNGVKAAFDAVVGAIQAVISWIGRIKFPSPPGWLSAIFGGPAAEFRGVPGMDSLFRFLPMTPDLLGAAPAPALTAGLFDAPGVFGRQRPGGTVVNNIEININGAVDPVGTARQIQNLLNGKDKTLGLNLAVNL